MAYKIRIKYLVFLLVFVKFSYEAPALCPVNTFVCAIEAKCLDPSKLCDGNDDCSDGHDEDEEMCGTVTCDLVYNIKCADVCVPLSKLCDGVPDCPNALDEAYCFTDCLPGQFRCSNGTNCLYRYQIRDGTDDCPDGEDELNIATACNDTGKITCSDGTTCVFKYELCKDEATPTCADKNIACPPECAPHQWRCDDFSRCLEPHLVCDGVQHCDDGSDEGGTGTSIGDKCQFTEGNCQPLQFECFTQAGSAVCINKDDICLNATATNCPNIDKYCSQKTESCTPPAHLCGSGSTCYKKDGVNHCICAPNKTHAVELVNGRLNITTESCGAPCNKTENCGNDDEARACFGTTDPGNYVCVCQPGFISTSNGCVAKCLNTVCRDDADLEKGTNGIDYYCTDVGDGDFQCTCSWIFQQEMPIVNTACSLRTACSDYQCGYSEKDEVKTAFGKCSNTFANHSCTCYSGYYESDDGKSCIAKCLDTNCGTINGKATGVCNGTATSYECTCTTIDSIQYAHPISNAGIPDLTRCEAPCTVTGCTGSVNGALACEGTLNDFYCICNSNYEHVNGDKKWCGHLCSQMTNEEKISACGEGFESCSGIYGEDGFCTCKTGYVLSSDKKCIHECMTNLTTACGEGASSCNGTIASPSCACVYGYYNANNGKCVQKPCSNVPFDVLSAKCGAAGCTGTFFNFTCACPDGYKYNSDLKQCNMIECSLSACGEGIVDGELVQFATSCTKDGNNRRECTCKAGYTKRKLSGGDHICDIDHCDDADCEFKEPAGTGGTETATGRCTGTKLNYTCTCDDGAYPVTTFTQIAPDNIVRQKCRQPCTLDCGTHGICIGYLAHQQCFCENGWTKISNTDLRCEKTVTSACSASVLCGTGYASCVGSYTDYYCYCKTGYKTSADGRSCEKVQCADASMSEIIEMCGEGATGCTGPLATPSCQCNATDNYYPTTTGTKCESPCSYNEDVQKYCGAATDCRGTYNDYVCVCRLYGLEVDPENPRRCREIACDDSNAECVCGAGAVTCTGTMRNPHCKCLLHYEPQTTNMPVTDMAPATPAVAPEDGFIASSTLSSCSKQSCVGDGEIRQKCGTGNTCIGNIDDYACVCTGFGWEYHPTDNKTCVERLCADDPVLVCGPNHDGCSGTFRNPTCKCKIVDGYVPASNGASCELANCLNSPDFLAKCGTGNLCVGTYTDFSCICRAVGYEYDPTNRDVCKETSCTTFAGDALTAVCGEGAESCKGTVLKPYCTCNAMEGYVCTAGCKSCVKADCSHNETAVIACGPGNTCEGNAEDWVCVCKAFGWINDEGPQSCRKVKCDEVALDKTNSPQICGTGATGCFGDIIEPKCQCDHDANYIPNTLGTKCVLDDCRSNPDVALKCGPGNTCRGTYSDYVCLCIAKGWRRDDTGKMCIADQCDAETDAVQVCGLGAISCEGPIYAPKCTCNTTEGFVPSTNGYSCIPADCRSNPVAMDVCKIGQGSNRCQGTFDNYICICDRKGYAPNDPANPTGCVETMCEAASAVEVCGIGATNCTGPVLQPTCECNTDYYAVSNAGTTCIRSDCRSNPETSVKCGYGNTCIGTYTDWQCVCQSRGWRSKEGVFNECEEIPCDETNQAEVCGEGVHNCTGTILKPSCICRDNDGFVAQYNTLCTFAACTTNPEVKEKCKEGNTCLGHYNSWHCVCSGKGYKNDPDDPQTCIEVMCSELTESQQFIDVCGVGAVNCSGSTKYPNCECDESNGFVANSVGTFCVPALCRTSNAVVQACGYPNSCTGTVTSYACICTAFGYRPHPTEPTSCQEVECNVDNAVEACGAGATKCEGTLINPACECDTEGYMLSGDKRSCLPADCKYNPQAATDCGDNPCIGTYFSYVCDCKAPQYMTNATNAKTCLPAPCKVEQCGRGDECGTLSNYASACEGTYLDPSCTCKTGYEGNDTACCKVAPCEDNCGGKGVCKGNYFNYECICNGPEYIQNPANPKQCILSNCDVNACGKGYINGAYTVFASVCAWNGTTIDCTCKEGFVKNAAGTCEIAPCPIDSCSGVGTCIGNYFDFTCDCPAPDYEYVPGNPHICREAPCRVEQCGFDTVGGDNVFRALSCTGTYNNNNCICKKGYTGGTTCAERLCIDVPDVCNGHGSCGSGTYFDYNCTCDENYENPDGNLHECKPVACNTGGTDPCGEHGTCVGDYFKYKCVCDHGYMQVAGSSADQPGCDVATCLDSQCGGSKDYPFGSCNGKHNDYTCTCHADYAHPALKDGSGFITTVCDYKCKVESCGAGAVSCEGSYDSFKCNCSAGYENPTDANGNVRYYMCVESCSDEQCGAAGAGTCSGPKSKHTCACAEGFEHPGNDVGGVMNNFCKDINECEAAVKPCHEKATCTNTVGSFECACVAPFEGIGTEEGGCYANNGLTRWEYSGCTSPCNGKQTRTRQCVVPEEFKTADLCDELLSEELDCNVFPVCQGCPKNKPCECSSVDVFTENTLPTKTLEHFDFYVENQLNIAFDLLGKWTTKVRLDLCEDQYSAVRSSYVGEIDTGRIMIENWVTAIAATKEAFRGIINCNESPIIRDELFETYKAIVERHSLLDFVLKDLKAVKSRMEIQVSKCDDDRWYYVAQENMLGKN